MKIDTHVLFLILIVGIISAGLVGANVINSDQSMKQETFDGIKVSVPSDSNFVKTADGVYKDSKYSITINTFKNNDSMINFLKNSKNSKVVPIENQPPQSVAFKKGDTINILVTNGKEGVAVSSKDGKLTAKIANTVIFSDNHKTQKPAPLNIINPPMDVHNDFNLILLLVADVDTKIFNLNVVENSLDLVANQYNTVEIEDNSVLDIFPSSGSNSSADESFEPTIVDNSKSDNVIANHTSNSSDVDDAIIQDPNDSNSSGGNELTASFEDISKTNEPDSSADSSSSSASSSSAQATASPASSSSPSSIASPSSPSSSPSTSHSSSSPSSSSSSNAAKYTYAECKKLVMDSLPSSLTIDERPGNPEQSGNDYIFHIKDMNNKDMGIIRVDSTTGKIDDTGLTK